jgi:hypothetical protein
MLMQIELYPGQLYQIHQISTFHNDYVSNNDVWL